MNQRNERQNTEAKSRNKGMKKFKILVSCQLISSIGSGLTAFGNAISKNEVTYVLQNNPQ